MLLLYIIRDDERKGKKRFFFPARITSPHNCCDDLQKKFFKMDERLFKIGDFYCNHPFDKKLITLCDDL